MPSTNGYILNKKLTVVISRSRVLISEREARPYTHSGGYHVTAVGGMGLLSCSLAYASDCYRSNGIVSPKNQKMNGVQGGRGA